MPVASWPSDLPYRALFEPREIRARFAPALRTEMEDGPIRQRRSTTARWTKLVYVMRFTKRQFEVADRFVTVDLADGTARFMMPVGRWFSPSPWPARLCYLDPETWAAGSRVVGINAIRVSFTLNVLDW